MCGGGIAGGGWIFYAQCWPHTLSNNSQYLWNNLLNQKSVILNKLTFLCMLNEEWVILVLFFNPYLLIYSKIRRRSRDPPPNPNPQCCHRQGWVKLKPGMSRKIQVLPLGKGGPTWAITGFFTGCPLAGIGSKTGTSTRILCWWDSGGPRGLSAAPNTQPWVCARNECFSH